MSELLDCQGLAAKLGRCPHYVTGMRRAGYEFEYSSLGKTTLSHALAWLKFNVDFVAHNYLKKGWKRLPKLPSAPASQPV